MSSCPETPKRIALVGMPNTGKSTVFNRLTGAAARIGNWPGVTVDLASATIALDGERVEVVDLPGIYDLHGFSEDEKVVRRFLESERLNLLVVVANAVQLDRQLALALQARTLGIPILLALNMADEAQARGSDRQREAFLGTPPAGSIAKRQTWRRLPGNHRLDYVPAQRSSRGSICAVRVRSRRRRTLPGLQPYQGKPRQRAGSPG